MRRLLYGGLACLLALLTACSSSSPEKPTEPAEPAAPSTPSAVEPRHGGTLQFGVPRDAISLDPHITQGSTSGSIQGNIYDTLVEYDEQGGFRGALAERWEVPDNTTYIFHLRQGVSFHNGAAFGARDVIATLDRIKNPATKATRKAMVDNMASYEMVDSHTVRITLKQADATFLHALASESSFIASAQDIAAGMDFVTKTNGTGPFLLESWEPQAHYTLKRNAKYWKPGLPYLDGILATPIQDDKARMNALRSGVVDLVGTVPWQESDALEADFQVFRHESVFNMVRLNNGRPPLDNKLVRQALNYVVDREAVLALAFGGRGRLMDGPLQPYGSPFYNADRAGHYRKDHDKARELLRAAGYNSPADVPPLEFTVANLTVHSETAQVVQNQLKEFGLQVTWKSVEVPVMNNNRVAGTYVLQQDGLSMSWPDPDFLRPLFHSSGTAHAKGVKFANARLDELLSKGAQSIDLAERQRVYREAEAIVLDEAPWIFLFWRPGAEAAHPKVRGYTVIPGGLGSFNLNRMEYIWLAE